MKLRLMEGEEAGKVVDLKDEGFSIGRDEDNDLSVDIDGVSRNHCRIVREGAAYVVEDLGSTNGVFVNGKKIEKRKTLVLNDKIRIGSQLILFTDARDIIPQETIAKLEKTAEKRRGIRSRLLGNRTAQAQTAVFAGFVLLLVGIILFAILTPGKPEDDDQADEEVDQQQLISPPGHVPDSTQDEPGDDETFGFTAGPDDDPTERPPAERPPLARQEKITYYWVRSVPAGATVEIDDEAAGVTPVILTNLKKGSHKLRLTKPGYQELTRLMHLPFKGEFFDYKLKLVQGICLITSTPTGMAVKDGPRILGYTPFILKDLPAGHYQLSLVGAGYTSQKITAKISPYKANTAQAKMFLNTGALRVISLPANAEVAVDGYIKGRTRPREKGESAPCVIRRLKAGSHRLFIKLPDGTRSAAKAVKVEHGGTTTVRLTVWNADTQVTIKKRKKKINGMFRRKKANGDLVLALSAKKNVVIKAANIIQVKDLEAEDEGDREGGDEGRREGGDEGRREGGDEGGREAEHEARERNGD